MPPVNFEVISNEISEISRFLMRKDDKNGLNEIMKNGLKITDFLLLDEELMNFLISKYRGFRLKREVFSNRIEIFPIKVH